MKVFFNYFYFPPEKIGEFIRNNSNNENWPSGDKYDKILNDWNKEFERQQAVVERYKRYVKDKKKENEDFLILIKSVISNKLKIVRDKDFKYLDHGTKTIELTDQLREKEIESLKKGLEIYEREKTFNGHWADVDLNEQTDWIATCRELRVWNENRQHPIDKVKKLIRDWEINLHKDDEEFPEIEQVKNLQIQLKERTSESIIFIWNVAKIDAPIFERDEYGKALMKDGNPVVKEYVKRKVFPNILNFVFLFNNQYYEVLDWEQTSFETAEIVAKVSIFYNFYWYLRKSSVNGIFHHYSGIGGGAEEICSCAEYDIATNWHDFVSDYKLKLALFKADKSNAAGGMYYCEASDERPPSVGSLTIHKVDPKEEVMGTSSSALSSIWNSLWNATVGTVFFTLSDKLPSNGGSIIIPPTNFKWKMYSLSGTAGEEINKFLSEKYDLLNPIMHHFYRLHLKGTLYWRKKQIWQGNYWLIANHFRVEEICNPSGIMINLWAGNMIIARVTESITQKVGGNALCSKFVECVIDTALNDDKGQNNRQVERNVISGSTSGGKTVKKESSTKTITKTRDLSGQDNKPGIGSNFLRPTLYNVDHTKSEYTTQQFEARYYISGEHPLTARVEFNQNLLNQYRSRRELKGRPLYTYFNAEDFGTILNATGFLQASIISLTQVPYADWFREKIENGVYIYDESHKEFYQKELTRGKNVASTSGGGTVRGAFNFSQSNKDETETISSDEAVHIDDMSWVWKSSTFRPVDGGAELFPKLIEKMKHNIKQENSDAWKFDGYSSGSGELAIPKGIKHLWNLKAFSPNTWQGQKYKTAMDDKGKVILKQTGMKWSLKWEGVWLTEKTLGDPEGIPATGEVEANPDDPGFRTPPPFNPTTPFPAGIITDIDPIGGGIGGPEMEPPEMEPLKEKEMPKEKEQEQIKEKVKERIKEKPKIRDKSREK